jgi:MoaA/NifB/PqqE/SkfB family radical SAM enzyme
LKKKHGNLLVFAVTTVTGSNVLQLDSIMDEFSRLGLFDDHFLTLVRGPTAETQLTGEEFELFRQAYQKLIVRKEGAASLKEAVNKAINKVAFGELMTSYQDKSNSFRCRAGEKMVNVTEQGDVCICEMHPDALLGNLRDHGYDIRRVLQLPASVERIARIGRNSCNCHWDCAIFCSLLFGGVFGYKKIVSALLKGNTP